MNFSGSNRFSAHMVCGFFLAALLFAPCLGQAEITSVVPNVGEDGWENELLAAAGPNSGMEDRKFVDLSPSAGTDTISYSNEFGASNSAITWNFTGTSLYISMTAGYTTAEDFFGATASASFSVDFVVDEPITLSLTTITNIFEDSFFSWGFRIAGGDVYWTRGAGQSNFDETITLAPGTYLFDGNLVQQTPGSQSEPSAGTSTVSITASAVPEPGTAILAILGGCAALFFRRSKQR